MSGHICGVSPGCKILDPPDRILVVVVMVKAWVPGKELEYKMLQLMLLGSTWPTAELPQQGLFSQSTISRSVRQIRTDKFMALRSTEHTPYFAKK